MFQAFRHKNYRLYFIGQFVSLTGTWMQRIAMSWLVYRLTGSAYMLGIISFSSQLPTFLIAPFAGVIADKFNRFKIIIWAQFFSMIQALVLATLVLTDAIQIWQIIVLGIALGIINGFDLPIRQSFVLEIVDRDKNALPNAIALNSSFVNASRLIGPTLAGFLIALIGEGYCFLINGLSYIAVLSCLLLMNIQEKIRSSQNKNIFKELIHGATYVWKNHQLRNVLLLVALVSLMGVPYQVLMPIFSKEILGGDSNTLGLLMGSAGAGSLMGALYLLIKNEKMDLKKIIFLASFIFGLGLILLSFSTNFYLSTIFLFIAGFGMIVQMASSNTFLQITVDDDKRGRVMSFYTMAFMGMAPFGGMLSGFLGDLLGTPSTFLIGGMTCVISSILFANSTPKSSV